MLRRLQWLPILAGVIWSAAMIAFVIAQETPTGDVHGRVVASDTGRPIYKANVTIRRNVHYESPDFVSRSTKTDAKGRFEFDDLPVGDYVIQAGGKVHRLPRAKITIREGRVEDPDLELAPSKPYLNLYATQRSFTSREKPEIVLDGFTQNDAITIKLHKVDAKQVLEGRLGRLNRIVSDNPVPDKANTPSFISTEIIQKYMRKRDSEGVYHQKVTFAPHAPGLYLVDVKADDLQRSIWLSVSDISIITKESPSDFLTYAVAPDTGTPITGGVTVKMTEEDQVIATGKTGPDGIWRARVKPSQNHYRTRLIVATYGDSLAFLNSYSYGSRSDGITIYTYTERPIYRPGHRVRFRGIVRKFYDDAYHTPKSGQVRVEARDRRNSLIYAQSLPLSRFGSFHGEFSLPIYAPTGEYEIKCIYAGKEKTNWFGVAEYRKPEFTVSVTTHKKRYVRGDLVKAKIKASYYFGAPVAGARVSYSISRSDYWFYPEEEDQYEGYEGDYEYEGGDYGYYGEEYQSGSAVTGPDGTAEVTFRARWRQPKEDYSTTDQQYSISAWVTDQSGREASGDTSVIATQGDIFLRITPDSYVAEIGKSARFKIEADSYDRKPQPDVVVDVTANREEWDKGEEESKYTQVASGKVRTDATGDGWFAFTPKHEGSYVIRAVARDSRGRLVKSAQWLWVPGAGEIRGYKYPDLQVIMDKKTYNQGETAKVLINSSETGVTALITVEGRRLYEHRLIKLNAKSTVVEIPIKSHYRPNFYISACYAKNKKFNSAQARAKISLADQSIKLVVTPDKPKYEPGEKATYLVKATDHRGKPVRAEVSLGVVDEAIYAIRKENTTPILDFFYARRENQVQTRYSFPEVYYSGDKAGFTGTVRKEFLDTAFWRANLVTGADGTARAVFKIPDNLTTWRATARACTSETAVGQTTSKVICSKKLLVRLVTPRFFVQNDRVVISALVHNYLPESQTVKVALKAPGVGIEGATTTTISVKSNGMGKVDWPITLRKAGSVVLTAYAVGQDAQDAMQLTIPVRPHGQRLVETRTGAMAQETARETLVIRADSVPEANEIRVRLAPSIAAGMLGSLDYLARYPYGCTEQTMSCFLPDVVIWRTLTSLGIDKPDLKRKLPDMVGKGLNRLYDFQHQDTGGWGWCEYGKDDLWMTAYVMYGLITARNAGFSVSRDVFDRGLASLVRQVNRTLSRIEQAQGARLYAVYVLSMTDMKQAARDNLQREVSESVIGPRENALVALTLLNLGDTRGANEYVSRLWKQCVGSKAEIHWEEPEFKGYYRYVAPAETTAYALMAVQSLTPEDSRIPKVIRWLMNQRRMNYWYSTRDTAMVLYALCDYLKQSKELSPDYTVRAFHNGKLLGSFAFDKVSIFEPEAELVVPASQMKGLGRQEIRFDMRGQGVLYHTIQLTQYVQRREKPKTLTGSGITVTREYRKLVPRWDQNWKANRLQPAASTSTSFKLGDVFRVKVVVNSPRDYYHILVEDYLPAGCEASDRGHLDPWEWQYWWDDQDVRDERVSFYVSTLRKGKNVFEYQLRASMPGQFHAMPTLVEAMYDPSINASGPEEIVRIK